jgi:hypothetical protein
MSKRIIALIAAYVILPEYLLGGRTVAYNWPCHNGVSFNCDC